MPVRWGSTDEMLEIFLYLEQVVRAVCLIQTSQDEITKRLILTDDQWNILCDIKQYFLIFTKLTVAAQADSYPTLYRIIPQVIVIKRQLQALLVTADRPILKLVAKAGYDVMEKYFKKTLISRALSVATVLNPRYKLFYFNKLLENEGGSQSIEYKRIEAHFKTTFNAYSRRRTKMRHAKQMADMADAEDLYAADESTMVEDPEAWMDPFYGFQDDRIIDDIPEDTRYINEKLLPPHKEVKNNTSKTVTDTAIQEYWARKGIESELLGQMARDFIAIPATSAPSERVFSSSGDIISRKRSRLSPATLRWVVCLRDWGVLSDDDDMDDDEGYTDSAVITV
jgi:hypothetical protein